MSNDVWILSTSRLPSYTWGYASYYAVYIKNRVPSSALTAKHQTPVSPYLLVYGQKPSFSNLHPFGCLCWVYISKQQSTGWKLSARGLPCVFLGLGNWQGRKAFLALDLSTRRVHATVNAKFDETFFPCRPEGYRRIHNLDLDLSAISHETLSSSVSNAMDSPNMFTYEYLDEPVSSPETLPPIPSLIQELPDDDADSFELDDILIDLPQPCSEVSNPEVPDPPIVNADAIPPARQQPFMQFFDEDIQEPAAWSFGSVLSDNELHAFIDVEGRFIVTSEDACVAQQGIHVAIPSENPGQRRIFRENPSLTRIKTRFSFDGKLGAGVIHCGAASWRSRLPARRAAWRLRPIPSRASRPSRCCAKAAMQSRR
jgi:hypothetical protein